LQSSADKYSFINPSQINNKVSAKKKGLTVKKNSPWLGIGAVLAAIGASACCVGPLLLLSLGFGGAWISNNKIATEPIQKRIL
jgi:hypothetical protein